MNLAEIQNQAPKYANSSNLQNAESKYGDPNNFKEKRPSGYRKFTMQQFTPEQMQLLEQMMGHVGPDSYLSKLALGDESMYEEMEKPAFRQYNDVIGGLGSRFSGMGMGARNSSGFQNTQNASARDFASQLQSNRQNLRRQAIMDLMGISHSLMNERPYERGLVEKPSDQGKNSAIGSGFGAAGGAILGSFAGNPVLGAKAGAAFGGAVGSMY